MRDIKREVRAYIAENFLFGSGEKWGDGDSLLGRSVLDSTGVLELVAFLEGTFAITIEDDELVPQNLDSLDAIAAYVGMKQGRAAELPVGAVS